LMSLARFSYGLRHDPQHAPGLPNAQHQLRREAPSAACCCWAAMSGLLAVAGNAVRESQRRVVAGEHADFLLSVEFGAKEQIGPSTGRRRHGVGLASGATRRRRTSFRRFASRFSELASPNSFRTAWTRGW